MKIRLYGVEVCIIILNGTATNIYYLSHTYSLDCGSLKNQFSETR